MSALEDDYRAHGFAGDLGLGRSPAVLVVDVCRSHLDDSSPFARSGRGAVARCARLVDGARRVSVPVLFTRVSFQPGGADGGLFWRKIPALRCWRRAARWAPSRRSPRPRRGEVVVSKQYASAFFGTTLASTLCANAIDTLLVCGLTTSGCIRATAVDALQHGFRPLVVSDACGERDPGPHEANLLDLRAEYADVLSTDEALARLEGRTGA